MTPHTVSLSSAIASAHLQRFIAGDPSARDLLPRLAEGELLKMARRFGRDLPADLLGEVVDEVWLYLLRSHPRYDPRLSTARAFLLFVMKNALRHVHAAYIHRDATRYRRDDPDAPSPITLDDAPAQLVPAAGGAQRVEAHADANRLLNGASRQVRRALFLVHVVGLTVTEAAERMSLTRHTLARRLERFSGQRAA